MVSLNIIVIKSRKFPIESVLEFSKLHFPNVISSPKPSKLFFSYLFSHFLIILPSLTHLFFIVKLKFTYHSYIFKTLELMIVVFIFISRIGLTFVSSNFCQHYNKQQ